MNRRELFKFLPGAALAPGLALVAQEPEKPAEPSPWVEVTCGRPLYGEDREYTGQECGVRYKVIRGTQAYCPTCGWTTSYMRPDNWGQFVGVEVK